MALIDPRARIAFWMVVRLSSLGRGRVVETDFPVTPRVWTTKDPVSLPDSASAAMARRLERLAVAFVTVTDAVSLRPTPT